MYELDEIILDEIMGGMIKCGSKDDPCNLPSCTANPSGGECDSD